MAKRLPTSEKEYDMIRKILLYEKTESFSFSELVFLHTFP